MHVNGSEKRKKKNFCKDSEDAQSLSQPILRRSSSWGAQLIHIPSEGAESKKSGSEETDFYFHVPT